MSSVSRDVNQSEGTISLIKEDKKWYINDLPDMEFDMFLHSMTLLMANSLTVE